MAVLMRVLLVGGEGPRWESLVRTIEAEGHATEVVPGSTEPADVAAQARQGDNVVFVDLSADLLRGMEMISACRRGAPAAPVVVVADSLSVDLARSIRAAGVFYLALHPLSEEELRAILDNALKGLGLKKPAVSTCKAKKRILLVDDDRDFCAAVVALLESEGYAVSCAGTGREGLQKIVSERPDLLVLDIMMEDACAGYCVNQAVKFGEGFEAFRSIPVLMVSSIPVDPAERFSRASEVQMVTPDAYLTKPLDVPQLLSTVKDLLASRAGM